MGKSTALQAAISTDLPDRLLLALRERDENSRSRDVIDIANRVDVLIGHSGLESRALEAPARWRNDDLGGPRYPFPGTVRARAFFIGDGGGGGTHRILIVIDRLFSGESHYADTPGDFKGLANFH